MSSRPVMSWRMSLKRCAQHAGSPPSSANPRCSVVIDTVVPADAPKGQRRSDAYSLYGTWPVGLARIASATFVGIGAQNAGISAATDGFKT